jgi:hypothetical protein
MQPTASFLLKQDSEPNIELLRRQGWSVGTYSGTYCMAWRGRDEVVFEWRAGVWHRVGGRGGADEV